MIPHDRDMIDFFNWVTRLPQTADDAIRISKHLAQEDTSESISFVSQQPQTLVGEHP
jgi:hypothetical protein